MLNEVWIFRTPSASPKNRLLQPNSCSASDYSDTVPAVGTDVKCGLSLNFQKISLSNLFARKRKGRKLKVYLYTVFIDTSKVKARFVGNLQRLEPWKICHEHEAVLHSVGSYYELSRQCAATKYSRCCRTGPSRWVLKKLHERDRSKQEFFKLSENVHNSRNLFLKT